MKRYDPDPKTDKWFGWQGKPLPKRTPHGLTEDEIDKKLQDNLKGHSCVWKQKGNQVFCDEGENRHGVIVSVNQVIIKTKNGQPVYGELKPQLRPKAKG